MSHPPEVLTTTERVNEALLSLADAHGVSLPDDKFRELAKVGLRMSARHLAGYDLAEYQDGGIFIKPRKYDADSDIYVSKIDFTPRINGEDVKKPTRDNISQIGIRGIKPLQNYILLMELTGLKPDMLRGITNPAMAAIATNFGFSYQRIDPRTSGQVIQASYEDVAAAAFSPRMRRIESILQDRFDREMPVEQKLQKVIDEKGLEIDPQRLEWLAKVASINRSGGSAWSGDAFYKDGLSIGATLDNDNIGTENSSTLSMIDFEPEINGVHTHEASPNNRDQLSSVGLAGIRALQDYVILVEAGYVNKPGILWSWATWPVAKMAKRFGFGTTRGRDVPRIEASYESLAEAAFSDDVRRLESVFEERVTRQRISGMLDE